MDYLRTYLVRERIPNSKKVKIDNAADVFELMKDMQNECQELMKVICLNTRHEVVGIAEVSRGTVDHTMVHMRDVFRPAILANATNLIMVHNHPSGDPTPSPDDIRMTYRLRKIGVDIGIPIIDHVIIGDTFMTVDK